MAFKHNYINTSGAKPLVSQVETLELVPNYADGTLWTKTLNGDVIALGERVYGNWIFPDITSSYNDYSVIIPSAERLKYRLMDLETVMVTGSFAFKGFSFNNWHTVFTLPVNVRGNIQGNCLGIGKVFDSHTASVQSAIDPTGAVRIKVGNSNMKPFSTYRIFIQVCGRRV